MSMTAAELTRKHCATCEGGVPRLSPAAVRDQLAALPEWKLTPDGQRIRREWRAKDFAADGYIYSPYDTKLFDELIAKSLKK